MRAVFASGKAGRDWSVGPRLIDRRDDEFHLCWLSWQLAWTASRGGIVDLVGDLRRRLTSSGPEEQIAALSFVADSADYCIQPEPAFFGGGRLPCRLGRDDPLRVDLTRLGSKSALDIGSQSDIVLLEFPPTSEAATVEGNFEFAERTLPRVPNEVLVETGGREGGRTGTRRMKASMSGSTTRRQ